MKAEHRGDLGVQKMKAEHRGDFCVLMSAKNESGAQRRLLRP